MRYSHKHPDRGAYAAVALGTDVALLTAASNDLTFERAYARQVEALVTERDLLIARYEWPGPNLLAAAERARQKRPGHRAPRPRWRPLRAMADIALVVDHDDTGRIQLVHMAVQHVIVGLVESRLTAPAHSVIDFSNRTVFVTGGSRGVGRAAALRFAQSGDVALSYHTRRDAAEEVAAEIRVLGRRAIVVGGDHADEAVVEHVWRDRGGAGGLDVFIANAGIWPERDVPRGDAGIPLVGNPPGQPRWVYLYARGALRDEPGGSMVWYRARQASAARRSTPTMR